MEQTQTWYDAAGNTVATADYQRLPADTTTGALTARTSTRHGHRRFLRPRRPGHRGRQHYGRQDVVAGAASVVFGSGGSLIAAADGNPAITEPASLPQPGPQSATWSAKRITSTTRPPARSWTKSTMPAWSRKPSPIFWVALTTIQNYVASGLTSGLPTLSDISQDALTAYQYDTAGRMAAQIVYDANGSSVDTEETQYLYQSPIDGSLQTAVIVSQ